MHFRDRTEAGRQLATALEQYKDQDCVVYPLPRGGVVLGVEIARHLNMPLDLIIPRKIGHPGNSEYAIGAITESGEMVCNQMEVSMLEPGWFERAQQRERTEARRRRERYLAGREPVPVAGKTAILVDDGIATGLTMEVSIRDLRRRQPARIVVAIPVVPTDVARRLQQQVDDLVALDIPRHYRGAVGLYYDRFDQVTDEQVEILMART